MPRTELLPIIDAVDVGLRLLPSGICCPQVAPSAGIAKERELTRQGGLTIRRKSLLTFGRTSCEVLWKVLITLGEKTTIKSEQQTSNASIVRPYERSTLAYALQ